MSKRRNAARPVFDPPKPDEKPVIPGDQNPKPDDSAPSAMDIAPPETVFSTEDAVELRLTESDISDLEREGLEDAKSIRAMKTPGVLAGLCGWEKDRAELVMNRVNSLRLRELKG